MLFSKRIEEPFSMLKKNIHSLNFFNYNASYPILLTSELK